MIFDGLQFLACRNSVNIIGYLFNGRMYSTDRRRIRLSRLTEHFGFQRKEGRIAGQRPFDQPAAGFAIDQMIGGGDQFRRREGTPAIAFYLVLSKMFGQFFYLTAENLTVYYYK